MAANGTVKIEPGTVVAGTPAAVVLGQPVLAANGVNGADEQCKIFVGGVGKNTTDMSLRAYFGMCFYFCSCY